jgi:hypothetical protein
VKVSQYFERCVMVERPYLTLEWCQRALTNPIKRVVQQDGRIRYWVYVSEVQKYLRVVTLPDGETLHTAFFDRGFKE